MTTDGFYKLQEGELYYAPETVASLDYELQRSRHHTYTYPVDGWRWFDSENAARGFYGMAKLVSPDEDQSLVPRWVQFGIAIGGSPEINAFVATVREAAPVLHGMLIVGLGQAAKGDPKTFLAAWNQAQDAGLVDQKLAATFVTMANGFNLPADFIAALSPPQP